jgi:hypothetical protein
MKVRTISIWFGDWIMWQTYNRISNDKKSSKLTNGFENII